MLFSMCWWGMQSASCNPAILMHKRIGLVHFCQVDLHRCVGLPSLGAWLPWPPPPGYGNMGMPPPTANGPMHHHPPPSWMIGLQCLHSHLNRAKWCRIKGTGVLVCNKTRDFHTPCNLVDLLLPPSANQPPPRMQQGNSPPPWGSWPPPGGMQPLQMQQDMDRNWQQQQI